MKGRLTGMKAMTVFIVFLLALPLTSRTNRFATLTVAVPSAGISLPLQLVIAYGWQIEVKEAFGYPWWTLGCFGVTFVTEREKVEGLKDRVLKVCRQTDWNPLTARNARSLASQQIHNWMREPLEWLRWQARIMAIDSYPAVLDPDQPARVRLDDLSAALKRIVRNDFTVLVNDPEADSLSFTVSPAKPCRLRLGFQRATKLHSSQRTHWLWWTVAQGDPATAMVLGELLGGGTGARWFQLLRGDKPIAYHAIAQVQWTPVGSELSLYSATMPNDFAIARQKTQQLLSELSRGRISGDEFDRAKRLAELKFAQMKSDIVAFNRTLAIWLVSGRRLDEWENLPAEIRSLSVKELVAFVRSLPSATEITAMP
jgi:hypothetical protein